MYCTIVNQKINQNSTFRKPRQYQSAVEGFLCRYGLRASQCRSPPSGYKKLVAHQLHKLGITDSSHLIKVVTIGSKKKPGQKPGIDLI